MLWLAAALGGLAGLATVMKHAADEQLHADAEHVALQWATFMTHHVPGMDDFLATGKISPDLLEELRAFHGGGEVMRFKIFDR